MTLMLEGLSAKRKATHKAFTVTLKHLASHNLQLGISTMDEISALQSVGMHMLHF